jgi:hypothetical protein
VNFFEAQRIALHIPRSRSPNSRALSLPPTFPVGKRSTGEQRLMRFKKLRNCIEQLWNYSTLAISLAEEKIRLVSQLRWRDSRRSLLGDNRFFGWFKLREIQRLFVEFSQNSSVSNTHDGGPPGFRTQQTKQVGLSGLIQG